MRGVEKKIGIMNYLKNSIGYLPLRQLRQRLRKQRPLFQHTQIQDLDPILKIQSKRRTVMALSTIFFPLKDFLHCPVRKTMCPKGTRLKVCRGESLKKKSAITKNKNKGF